MNEQSGQSEQARRVVFMLTGFLEGKRYTTKELVDIFSDKGQAVTLRTVQRDLRLLQECVPIIEQRKHVREVFWSIPRDLRQASSLVRIDSDELLSFYVLKAHLNTFKGTIIETELKLLEKKLEELAPGQAYSEESLYWDQNVGQFDYSGWDRILRKIITSIVKEKWVNIKYRSTKLGTEKIHDVMLRKLFTYYGIIYVIAYFPKHDSNVALTLQGFLDIKDSELRGVKAPPFDFKEFTSRRFGVFDKPRLSVVKLRIDKHYAYYFLNRRWHSSQKQFMEPNGDLIMEMRVPLVPDFISWILSWHEAITVLKPVELIDKIKYRLEATLKNYTTSGT